MSVVLKTLDQVLGSPMAEGPQLSFEVGHITARDIVRERVRLEVERYNSHGPEWSFVSLVAPAKEERELNEPLEAVRKRRVVILFNGAQVDDLDAPLVLTPISEARFLKLVPLVGG